MLISFFTLLIVIPFYKIGLKVEAVSSQKIAQYSVKQQKQTTRRYVNLHIFLCFCNISFLF